MEPLPAIPARLGFGLMRLPRKDGAVDLPQTCEMVDRFLAAGCTYFDTAYVYDGSEDAAREALVKRHPRDSFLLATKLAAWAGCKSREDAVRQFETSLARTGAGHFDFFRSLPRVREIQTGISELILDYLRAHPLIDIPETHPGRVILPE